MDRQPHILNAASNLLGISFVIITGLKLTGASRHSFADEVALGAAVLLSASCLLAYLALRRTQDAPSLDRWADRSFLFGLIMLAAAVLLIALGLAPVPG